MFCLGGFCPGGFCPGGFVRGVLSGGFCPGGFCPRLFLAIFDTQQSKDDGIVTSLSIRSGFFVSQNIRLIPK